MKLVRLFALATLAGAAAIAVMTLLPHDPYIRWQAQHQEAYGRLGWAYERIHDDPTPVDVAFIGTSHTLNGVDAAAVADGINVGRKDGRCVTTTNLAITEYGRNLHWLLARELLETRPVKLLVLEVLENESRKPHPLFAYVGQASDILGAPLLINLNWWHDIVRLPFRQAALAVKSLAPRQFGLKRAWTPADYDGSTVDNTRFVNVAGVTLTPLRDRHMPVDALRKEADDLHRQKNLHMLGARFADLEFAFPRHYLNAILELAAKKRVPVAFLYLPGYGQPPQPYDISLYAGRGDLLQVNDILRRSDIWFDPHHLTAHGAALTSMRLGEMLARRGIEGSGAPAPIGAPCGDGLPPRAHLTAPPTYSKPG